MQEKTHVEPNAWRWLALAAGDWAVIGAALAVGGALPNPVTVGLAVLLIGSRQHALALLGHDAAHRLVTKNRPLNDFLGTIFCFGPLLYSLEGYRRFHFKHHRTVGTAADPELHHKNSLPQWSLPLRRRQVLLRFVGDFVGGSVPHIMMLMRLSKPPRVTSLLPSLLAHAAIVALCVQLGVWWVPALWYASLSTAFWAVFRLRVWSEHIGTDSTWRLTATWWQRALFLPHNTWCHGEHHDNASVPCWALPTLARSGARRHSIAELAQKLS